MAEGKSMMNETELQAENEVYRKSVIWPPDYQRLQAQLARVRAERDLLLSAIRPEEYETIKARMVAISEAPDAGIGGLV